MRSVRRPAVLALGLLLAACGSTGGRTTPSPSASAAATASAAPSIVPGSLAWTPCTGDPGLRCASLRVPIDYSNPSLGDFTLALIDQPATGTRKGYVVTNPGGPGGSGVQFLELGGENWGTLNQHYDIVSFDPRGVGFSTPAVHCLTASQLTQFIGTNPSPTTAAQIQTAVTEAKQYAQACEQNSGSILPYVGTANAARDMDQIRQALGEPKLNYLGFSYGTYLGAVYATLFPHNVGHMVLDGVVDPALSVSQMDQQQAASFEDNLNAMFAACTSTCPIYNNGNPSGYVTQLMNQIAAHPMAVGSRQLNSGEAFLGLLAGLYSPSTWGIEDQALAQAGTGNGTALLALADSYTGYQSGSYSNEFDANTAINCADGPASPPLPQLEQLATQMGVADPHFGISEAYGTLTCLYWPFPPIGRVTLSAPSAPPILLIGGTHDPATPYAWAQAVHTQLTTSILVTRDGYGHTSYGQSSCVHQIVNNFFIDNSLPTDGQTCPSNPTSPF